MDLNESHSIVTTRNCCKMHVSSMVTFISVVVEVFFEAWAELLRRERDKTGNNQK